MYTGYWISDGHIYGLGGQAAVVAARVKVVVASFMQPLSVYRCRLNTS